MASNENEQGQTLPVEDVNKTERKFSQYVSFFYVEHFLGVHCREVVIKVGCWLLVQSLFPILRKWLLSHLKHISYEHNDTPTSIRPTPPPPPDLHLCQHNAMCSSSVILTDRC